MFNAQPFYHSLIRKYVIMIGSIFDDVYIERTNNSINQTIKVPITYAPKEKVLSRLEGDPNINREYSIILPRISFEFDSLNFDPSRKLSALNRIPIEQEGTLKSYQYVGKPYNLHFRVYIYIKNTEDGTKIIEQILPYFDPDWIISAELVPGMGNIDIPVVLENVTKTEQFEGSYKNRKYFVWELDLTVKGYFYGPTKEKKIIKYVYANIYAPVVDDLRDAIGIDTPEAEILVKPGLTANGEPTTSSNNSISALDINIDDDFGYITEITEHE